ncbi:hypothetical protein ALC57_13493, partial [Trachymyrmex cornetzi]
GWVSAGETVLIDSEEPPSRRSKPGGPAPGPLSFSLYREHFSEVSSIPGHRRRRALYPPRRGRYAKGEMQRRNFVGLFRPVLGKRIIHCRLFCRRSKTSVKTTSLSLPSPPTARHPPAPPANGITAVRCPACPGVRMHGPTHTGQNIRECPTRNAIAKPFYDTDSFLLLSQNKGLTPPTWKVAATAATATAEAVAVSRQRWRWRWWWRCHGRNGWAARGQFSSKKILILISCKWPPLPLPLGYSNTTMPVAVAGGEARRGLHGAVVHEGLRDEGGARVAPGAGDSKLRSKDGWAKREVRRATKQ